MGEETAPIVKVDVTTRRIPIHVPFTISRESLPEAALALVVVTDAAGLTGVGEASPFSSLTHDDVATAAATARALGAGLIGRVPSRALEALAEQQAEAFRVSTTGYTGLESALWDLRGRQLGRSLAALWSESGAAPRVTQVTSDITLPIMAPTAVAGFWERFGPCGFPVVKIKVSGNVTADLDLVHALVRAAPPGTAVTLDGNQGYGLDAARQLVERLLAGGIKPRFFEQPLPEDDHAGLARLQAGSPVPVCLDETVRSPEDARRAVRGKLGGLVNVKTMKSGLAGAREIVRIVRDAGLELMIGGMLESEIAMGVSLQLACGTGAFEHIDLDTPFFFAERLTTASPWHAGSATLLLPTGAGHGLTLAR